MWPACAEGTSARKSERKMTFSFAFRSLIRTFGLRRRHFRSEKRKKNDFFFCFSLAYSYLCTQIAKLSNSKPKISKSKISK